MQLNPPQQQAIAHQQGPLLILAGAGSGKTRVITEKIAQLLRQHYCQANQIFALTFTQKAAKEMQQRLKHSLGQQLEQLTICTFHALGLSILKKHGGHLKLRRGFSILDPQDVRSLLEQLIGQHQLQISDLFNAAEQISDWKNHCISAQQALLQANNTEQRRIAQLYQYYMDCLCAYNSVDFDDLIYGPVKILEEDTQAGDYWPLRCRYLLVDEYQDTNLSQYRLIKLLTAFHQNFTVVGDDDQSIYAWRGARPENLRELTDDFPQLTVIKLEQNYRCSQRILAAANYLIDHNPHLFSKKLWSKLPPGAPIRVLESKDEQDEALSIAHLLRANRLQDKLPWHEYAILYRSNHQAKCLEQALLGQNIPYQISGGGSFFSRSEIKDVLAYARLLANPDDDPAYLRVINVPRRQIGPTTLQKLSHYAHQRGSSLFRASTELGLAEQLNRQTCHRLSSFAQLIEQTRQQLTQDQPLAALKQLVQAIDYDSWLRLNHRDRQVVNFKLQAIDDLYDWLSRLLQPQADFAQALQNLLLQDRLERDDNEQDNQSKVQLMTLHAAKGLEFSQVFIAGLEEQLLPHHASIEAEQIDEERRLMYVGMTRAKQRLILSLAKSRSRFGERSRSQVSRFLHELPSDSLDWPGATTTDNNTSQQSGAEHLANLKALLAQKAD